MLQYLLQTKERISTFFLLIIHIVGTIGIGLPLHPDFVRLTPLNLIVSTAILLYNETLHCKYVLLFLFIFTFGFLAEAYGTNFGVLFGEYHYGEAMGWGLWNTPMTAGLLWLIVVCGVGAFVNTILPNWAFWAKALLGAAILVSLDTLIEPVAMRLHFWNWPDNTVPAQNYVGWYLVGFLQLTMYHYIMPHGKNRIAILLLIIQFLFFTILNLSK